MPTLRLQPTPNLGAYIAHWLLLDMDMDNGGPAWHNNQCPYPADFVAKLAEYCQRAVQEGWEPTYAELGHISAGEERQMLRTLAKIPAGMGAKIHQAMDWAFNAEPQHWQDALAHDPKPRTSL